ncbi:MAG: hypothetical protein AB8G99_18005 [Planctomycetaceae bacterium]
MTHRYELQDRYLELTKTELPAHATRHGWSITHDHCFMRIILDQLFGDCWYNHLDRRVTAYKQLNDDQLRRCIAMAEQLMLPKANPSTLVSWNAQSLIWRGKLK